MSVKGFTEILETRVCLSASNSSVFSTAVIQDRLEVQIDLLKFRTDCVSATLTILTDISAIKSNDPQQATTVVPAIKKMRSDLATMHQELLADRLTQSAAVFADESTIVSAKLKILKDKGNTSAESTDHSVLLADRIKLQDDMIAGLNSRITTRQAFYTTIFNDSQAILTAVEDDPHTGAKLQADVMKWTNDRTTILTTLTDDLQTLVAARMQLVTDLTAEQNS